MVLRPSWAQRSCEVVCVAIAVVGPTMVILQDRGGLGMSVRFGRTCWCNCVVAVFGLCDRRVGTAWRRTPVIHDEPDRRPNRSAFALTGPSPILRCWFGKGTPLIAAEPLSWVSPCLTSCCHPFPFFGFVVGLVCPRHMVDWPQCVCAAVDASLVGFARWRYFVDMWVAEGHTARWPWLCVLFVHRVSVWV